jgi:DNA mismatch endonuclease (patch repair protein)
MRRIRCKDTACEMRLRRIVHAMGYRYRLHDHSLPGRPDLVFGGRRKIILIHGCFWHQHGRCGAKRIPKSHGAYWKAKLDRNVRRDRRTRAKLWRMGWQVLVVWECEIQNEDRLRLKVSSFLDMT